MRRHAVSAACVAAALMSVLALGGAASIPDKTAIFEKILEVHGTYLPGTDPMPCGSGPMSSTEAELVKKWFMRVASWPNFRDAYPKGTWSVDEHSCHMPREPWECLKLLEDSGVPFEKIDYAENIYTPVRITGPVGGVDFVYAHDLVVDCEMAVVLPVVARVLASSDITSVGILSAHRPESQYSFHSIGLAFDWNWVKHSKWKQAIWVKSNFEVMRALPTCGATQSTPQAEVLASVACDLWEARVFNTVITPNYNEGHANHFHLDLRPGDNRFYVR